MMNRNALLLLSLLGCGRPDGGGPAPGPGPGPGPGPCGCQNYQVCTADRRCVVDRGRSWFFSVERAVLARPVRSYVVIDGNRTSIQPATDRPVWNEGLRYGAGELLDRGARVEVFESGLIFDSSLSQPRRLLFTEEAFAPRTFTQTGWDEVLSITFQLRPE